MLRHGWSLDWRAIIGCEIIVRRISLLRSVPVNFMKSSTLRDLREHFSPLRKRNECISSRIRSSETNLLVTLLGGFLPMRRFRHLVKPVSNDYTIAVYLINGYSMINQSKEGCYRRWVWLAIRMNIDRIDGYIREAKR